MQNTNFPRPIVFFLHMHTAIPKKTLTDRLQISTMNKPQSPYDSLPHISEYYDNSNSHNSALHLILTIRPDWREAKDTIEFVRFTDGITNTLLKAVNKLPGLSKGRRRRARRANRSG